jgi:predicted RNA-binding Zn ribbon-like protein
MNLEAQSNHEHAVDLEVALDFVNTLELCDTRSHAEYGRTHDAIDSPSAAVTWLVARDLLHVGALQAADGAGILDRAREVRAAFRELFDAAAESRPPASYALEIVNGLLASREVPALEADGDTIRLSHRHVADPLDEAFARLADPIVDTIAEQRTDRFRVCANDRCRYVFFDESRAGRRRWCDMSSCGNRAKAARHRARAKAS